GGFGRLKAGLGIASIVAAVVSMVVFGSRFVGAESAEPASRGGKLSQETESPTGAEDMMSHCREMMEKMDGRMGEMQDMMATAGERMGRMDATMARMGERMATMDERMGRMERMMRDIHKENGRRLD
ncbi:MAG: hypothetical protein ACRDJF_06250, partial [Actinomycetota bacterium]